MRGERLPPPTSPCRLEAAAAAGYGTGVMNVTMGKELRRRRRRQMIRWSWKRERASKYIARSVGGRTLPFLTRSFQTLLSRSPSSDAASAYDGQTRTDFVRKSLARALPLSDVEQADERRDGGLPTVCLASYAGRSFARAPGLRHHVQNRRGLI